MQKVTGSGVVATLINPAPAKIAGPRVIGFVRVAQGEVDVKALGDRIDPKRHEETVKRAQEAARQHRR